MIAINRGILRLAQQAMLGLMCFGCFMPLASADVDVLTAQIVRVGIDPRFEGPMVQLTDLAAQPKWAGVRQFYLSSILGNDGLATLLTALSLNQPVFVRISGTAQPGSLITIIFVNNPVQ
ncbi:MAG: hypothetical protein OEV58_15870 [Gammaproteobacteria bacterium]|nr:hypothetical protein [Gammaproteobacteria bacterium]